MRWPIVIVSGLSAIRTFRPWTVDSLLPENGIFGNFVGPQIQTDPPPKPWQNYYRIVDDPPAAGGDGCAVVSAIAM
jgi:hypothetical protein